MDSSFIKDYQHVAFPRNIRRLYIGNLVRNLAVALIGVFGTIFFFEQLGHSVVNVIMFFLVGYGLFLIFTPIFARGVSRPGIKKMMLWALPFLALSFVSLILWQEITIAFAILYMVGMTLYRLLYWTPYHIDFALFTQQENRGKQMALLMNISAVVLAVAPVAAGFMITSVGYIPVFGAGLVLTLAAMIPLSMTEPKYEEFTFGFVESFRRLFTSGEGNVFVAHAANGMQHITTTVMWPVFIFLALDDYAAVGLITTLVLLVTIAIRFVVGRLNDRYDDKKVLPITTFIFTTGWVLKMFVETGLGIFLIDSYHSAGRAANKLAFNHTFYEQAAEHGDFIDEFAVLRSLATNLGRVIMLGVAIPLVIFGSMKMVFLVTAVMSLLMMFAVNAKKK